MCGIFGVIGTNSQDASLTHKAVKRLFLLSESRGKEASGFAYTDGNTLYVHRTPSPAHTLIKEREFADAMSVIAANHEAFAFIGHSRLATNGSPYADDNNQPVIGDESVIVHNGIIVNADVLWHTHFPNTPPPELDTMVMARVLDKITKQAHFDMQSAIKKLYRGLNGETSIALLSKRAKSLYLATNTGSVYFSTTTSGLFVFSSERYITRTVLDALGQTGTILQLHANEVMEVPFGQPHAHVKQTKRTITQVHYAIKRMSEQRTITISHDLYRNSLANLKKHEPRFAAIQAITRCQKCILPITMPLISFDKSGVCNFCRTYTVQKPKGERALESLVAPFRLDATHADCIVALSGGRDSSFGLHYAKKILGLNPIAYTYDWGMVTDVARRNQSRMVSALGVEHVWVSANIDYKRKNIKKNVEAWLAKPDIAMVPLFMAGDKQAEYYVEELKRKTGIKLAIYCRGNQLEDERFKFGYYGIFDGTPKGVIHDLSSAGKLTMAAYFAKACLNNPRYINSSLVDTAFAYASSYLMQHRDFVYLWHYIPWNEQALITTLKNIYGWETAKDSLSTWRIDDGTPPFYNYIYYHIQGFTEHDGLRSNQIREGHISRDEALRITAEENKPRYESLKWYFDVIGIDGDRALSVIDRIPTRY